MSAQACPVCGMGPGLKCRPLRGESLETTTHVARLALEYGDWVEKYDRLYRDKKLRFQCRPYAA